MEQKKSDQTEVKHGRQPTADQLRIAQLTDNTSSTETSHLNALIEQYMQCTGLDREEAIVFLHDHDNNVAEAVNAFFEGEQASSGWSERTKKKKPKAKVEPEVLPKENRRGGGGALGEAPGEEAVAAGPTGKVSEI